MEPIPYFGMRSSPRIGRALRDARKRQGLAQADVALAAGITREAVSRLESGKAGMRVDTLVAVLRALGHELVFWPRSRQRHESERELKVEPGSRRHG